MLNVIWIRKILTIVCAMLRCNAVAKNLMRLVLVQCQF
ncbi:hypothetical protein VEx25_1067 [Vibrio antiquarius]|uniref:Uncharacterized protein n=1 Tax=Vibrio antiquarius (strain Ex25) TaxID=150340 RepID=A0ABM9WX68_VIBAE|nr:hypothetical protein VEx25_1067 [Vibrio antiquarius]